MRYRKAHLADAELLAEMNHQLIQDEGHRNPMTVPELGKRMVEFLEGEYDAVIFRLDDNTPVAYALYRRDPDSIYLRQFFVHRDYRRQGLGRQAMQILLSEIWPRDCRITVEVLVTNATGHEFWKSMGFQDYSIMLELARDDSDRRLR